MANFRKKEDEVSPRFAVTWSVVMCVLVARSIAAADLPTPTPPAAATPTPSPTQRDPCLIAQSRDSCCGNGRLEAEFEECDDGNNFDGDGCSSLCTRETLVTSGFEPLLVGGVGFATRVRGSVTFTKAFAGPAIPPIVSVRRFQTDPSALAFPHAGTLCIRGVVPADQIFFPGNVGRGTLGLGLGSSNILNVKIFVQQWIDPLEGNTTDYGPDGIPCTDDDPGLAQATAQAQDFKIALPPSCTGDANADGQVTIDEIIAAVNNALGSCPAGSQ